MTRRLLDARKAAEYLSISRATLYELKVRSLKIGRRRLFDVMDLDFFVETLKKQQDNGGFDNRIGHKT